MTRCNCGLQFPGSLLGAWEAKLHAEDEGHRLRSALPETGPPAHPRMDRYTRPPVR